MSARVLRRLPLIGYTVARIVGQGAFMSPPLRAYLSPELLDHAVVRPDGGKRNERRQDYCREHPARDRQLGAGAVGKPQHERGARIGTDAEDPADLVALRPAAADAHVRDVLAVVADHVVPELRLELEQELSTFHDLPRLVGRGVMASEPAIAPVADHPRLPAALEVRQRYSIDRSVGLVHDPPAELDHPIIADVDAVMVIQ